MPLYPIKFAFNTESNERIEAVVTMPREQRCVLHGTVYDADGVRVADAVVRLFECGEEKTLPVADAFTDGDGEFVFGPLDIGKRYIAKVYVNAAVLREVTIRPRKPRKKMQS